MKEAQDAAAKLAEAKRVKEAQDVAAKLAEATRVKEAQDAAAKLAQANRIKEAQDAAAKLAEANRVKEAQGAAAKLAEANRVKEAQNAAAKLAEATRVKEAQDAAAKLAEANRLKEAQDAAAKLAESNRVKEAQQAATKLAEATLIKAEKEAAAKLEEDNRLWAEQQAKNRLAEENRIKEEKETAAKLANETRLRNEREAAEKLAEANRLKAAQEAAQKAEKEAVAVSSKVLVGGNTAPNTAPNAATEQKKPLFEQNKIVNANGVKDPTEIVNNPGDKNPTNPNEVVAADGTKMIKQADGTWKILAAGQSQTPTKVVVTENLAKSGDSKKYTYLTAKGVELDTTQDIITLEDRLEFDPTGQFVVFKGMVAGEDMPRFVLTDINGKSVTQEEMKDKVIFIDFWASWCSPCVAQFSHTKILMDKYKNDDVLFLYISIDVDLESWKEYLKENTMAGVHANDKLILPLNFQVTGIPNSFIIAKNGKIAFNSRLKSKLNDDHVLQVLLNVKK